MITSTTTTLPKYTAVLDNILPDVVCKGLIDSFDCCNQEKWDRNGAPKFTQVNVNQDKPEFVKPLVKFTMHALDKYQKLFPLANYFLPTSNKLEEFRVKRYNSGNDRYDNHIDVESLDSSPRYLAFLFYLNHDFSGGQTEFVEGASVMPRAGSVLVFPPYWMYPHAGKRVISGTKYIMSTYLHLA